MLRYIYGDALASETRLRDTMFRDRALQFRDRLKWDVTVDAHGHERDEYDAINPLYAIWVNRDGSHGGSMRLLPTNGRTMVNDHFGHVLPAGPIASRGIWECTRFCLSPNATSNVAAALMLAGGEVMRGFDLQHLLGVYDARMVRIYKSIGASPTPLGATGDGRDKISVGLWAFQPLDRARVLRRAGLSSQISQHWFTRSFGRAISVRTAA